eukprot:4146245-Pyramimonas_sp.AAC.1
MGPCRWRPARAKARHAGQGRRPNSSPSAPPSALPDPTVRRRERPDQRLPEALGEVHGDRREAE